jgi:DNA (cytosine-5)-methyltransferase 3A
MVATPVCVAECGRYGADGKSVNLTAQGGGLGAKTGLYTLEVPIYAVATEWDENGKPIKAKSYADGKEYPVYEVKDGQITIKGKTYPIKLKDGFYIIRKLTVRECMRLQTVPEWYEFPVSDSQAYKMLGNGWTVDVIVHILSFIREG